MATEFRVLYRRKGTEWFWMHCKSLRGARRHLKSQLEAKHHSHAPVVAFRMESREVSKWKKVEDEAK